MQYLLSIKIIQMLKSYMETQIHY